MTKFRKRKFLVDFNNNANNKGKRNNPNHFIFFDTETNQCEEIKHIGKKDYTTIINTLKMGWAVYWNRLTDKSEWFYFENVKEFHTFVSKIMTITGKDALWLIAHNIVFDNFIVDIWDFLKSRGYEDNFIHTKGMVFLQKLVKYNLWFDKKTNEIKKKTVKVIMLVNNGNIFPTKLDEIGKTVGFKKLEVDFEKSTKEELKIYCKRDVEILLEFWRQWANFISVNSLGNLKYTISSQSLEAYKRKFCKDYIVLDSDMDNIAFERLAYYGGRTEIFYKGIVKKPIFYFDVNSMYPYVMHDCRFPREHKFIKKNPSLEQVEYYIKTGWLVIAECYMNSKNNCYPAKIENTLLFPTGKFKTYLATPEVIEGLNNGDIESFGKVSLYTGGEIFSDYIDYFYNLRLTYKRQCSYKHGHCERLPKQKFKDNLINVNCELCEGCKYKGNKQEKMIKLFLNSLYGKFGQMMDSWIKTSLEEIKQIDPNFDFDAWILDDYKIPKMLTIDGTDITPNIRYIGGELQIAGEKEESDISFPAIAAHVTSYARMILWSAIKYCQQNNIKYYYCDTDSIFTEKELSSEMIDENLLGKFKLETFYPDGVEFINLKNYCPLTPEGMKMVLNNNDEVIQYDGAMYTSESKLKKGKAWKMKGVSANAEIIDENNFIVQEWGGLPKQEYYRKFGRKPGEFWVIYKQKTNHGIIKKGVLTATGDINPFNLN